MARYEPKFQEALAALESALISVEDVGATLRDYAGGIHASPEHLAEVEDRLAAIDRLKRKYGATLDDVIAFGAEAARKLSEMENKDEVLGQLRSELSAAAHEYLTAARALSKKRYEAARKLEKLVEAAINDLAMKSSFHIEVTGSDEEQNWSASGFDQVAYMISTNPGEPLRRLEHIASGGELSRVMLALKASVEATAVSGGKKKGSGVPRTLDSTNRYRHRGRAADSVGKKLKELSRTSRGAVRDPPSADRDLRRPPLPHREEGIRGPHENHGPQHHRRRAHRRSCAHAERRQGDGKLPKARRADDQGECLRAKLGIDSGNVLAKMLS